MRKFILTHTWRKALFFGAAALACGAVYAYGSILDNRFFSCRAANSAGVFNVPTPPYYVPAGWGHSSDRDGDGISCEPKRY
jgi:hypothetical protein